MDLWRRKTGFLTDSFGCLDVTTYSEDQLDQPLLIASLPSYQGMSGNKRLHFGYHKSTTR